MVEIECENSGFTHDRRVVGKGETEDEAREDAFENDAVNDPEAGVWHCQECVQNSLDEYQTSGYTDHLPGMNGDPLNDYMVMKGER
jgi:hypothetical protein